MSFIEEINKEGFVHSSEWKDFWINDLNSLTPEKSENVEEMNSDEVYHAYEVTKSCEGLSNDFDAIPLEWFEEWLSKDEAFIFKLTVEGDISIFVTVAIEAIEPANEPMNINEIIKMQITNRDFLEGLFIITSHHP